MIMENNRITIQIHSYDYIPILNNLQANDIPVFNFKIKEDDIYEMEIDFTYENKIKKLYPDVKILKRSGILGRIKKLFLTKISLISLILSSLLFFDLNNRISTIKVIGTSRKITSLIQEEVKEMGIVKLRRKPNYETLIEVENALKTKYLASIDFVEVRLKGTVLTVKYQVRKDTVQVPTTEGAKYATKNGLISYFVLSSGEKMVEENQYVTQGTLLVSDYIIDSSGNNIYIGAYGQVYAITWTIIEIEEATKLDEVSAFSYIMDKAKNIMCKGFYLDERVLEEKILNFHYEKDSMVRLKIHFTCLEDIAN